VVQVASIVKGRLELQIEYLIGEYACDGAFLRAGEGDHVRGGGSHRVGLGRHRGGCGRGSVGKVPSNFGYVKGLCMGTERRVCE